jgi:hypothetical protein
MEYTPDIVQISSKVSMTLSVYLGITQSQIQSLRSAAKNGVPHPVAALALAEPPHQGCDQHLTSGKTNC